MGKPSPLDSEAQLTLLWEKYTLCGERSLQMLLVKHPS